MEALIRFVFGSAFGGLTMAAQQPTDSVLGGIVVFAVGIVVGLACVLVMDFTVRRHMRREYEEWVAAGRPERRRAERRRSGFRRSHGQY